MGLPTTVICVSLLAFLGVTIGQPSGSSPSNCGPNVGCPFIYAPLCGSDGRTYNNDCLLEAGKCSNPNLRKVHDGGCGSVRPSCDRACPANYDPVCGSDGRTYSNACALGVASCKDPSIRQVSVGPCGSSPNPPNCKEFCPFNYAPVCGSDGKTYSNECTFESASCKNPNLKREHDGECGSSPNPPKCSDVCPFNYAPVCGSDGKTYSNECTFESASCKNPNLKREHDGECGSSPNPPRCSDVCPFNYEPVCGSDGKTYSNECTFESASCKNPNLKREHDGECGSSNCPMICPANYAPVCGSDGKTYSNDCDLNVASCRDPSIKRVRDGECGYF